MKKFLYSIFAFLFVLMMVPCANVQAEETTEIPAITIGQTYTIPKDTYSKEYTITLAAGQKVTFYCSALSEWESVDTSTDKDGNTSGVQAFSTKIDTASYYIVSSTNIKKISTAGYGDSYVLCNTGNQAEKATIKVYNETWDYKTQTATTATAFCFVNDVEVLSTAVTKASYAGNANVYAFTPKLSGTYSFTVKVPNNAIISGYIAISTFDGKKFNAIDVFDDTTYTDTYAATYRTTSCTLKAGVTYYLTPYAKDAHQYTYTNARYNYSYKDTFEVDNGYTLSISQTPSVAVANVTAKKATAAKKAVKLTWKKAADVSGYEISYSTSKKFTNAKVVYTGAASASKKITGLKSKKTYYVRVRAFRVVEGNAYYGAYSKTLKAKAK